MHMCWKGQQVEITKELIWRWAVADTLVSFGVSAHVGCGRDIANNFSNLCTWICPKLGVVALSECCLVSRKIYSWITCIVSVVKVLVHRSEGKNQNNVLVISEDNLI